MSDILVWGIALIIPIIVIITYILAQRYRIRMTVEKGLLNEKKEQVTIIEAGSNFTTRMSDFKKNINRLNDAMSKRNEMITELQSDEHNTRDNTAKKAEDNTIDKDEDNTGNNVGDNIEDKTEYHESEETKKHENGG